MHKNLLLLSERDFLTLPIIRSLDPSEYTLYVMGPAMSAVRFSRFCEKYFRYPEHTDENKDDVFVEYINALSQEYNIDAIIPLDLPTSIWTAENHARLSSPSLPLSSGDTLTRLHDKWELTKVLDELALPYPETILVETRESLIDGAMEYPFMVKPLSLEAGKGIIRIESETDLERYRETKAWHTSYPILVQEYIEGTDVGMSILAVDGEIITWTIQRWNEVGLLELIDNQATYDIGEKIVAKEKYSGFMHIDLQMDSTTQDVYILECNPRTWGSMNASILNDMNFIDDAVACIQSKPIKNSKIRGESYSKFRRSFITLITRPWRLHKFSSISKRDLRAVLTDPIPYLFLAISQGMKKIFNRENI